MKYIDADKLKAQIKGIIAAKYTTRHPEEFQSEEQCMAAAETEEIGLILDTIEELQQEQQEVDVKVFNTLVSLGYSCDANGNIPTYEQTFESCKNALVYWLQENVQRMLAKKRIDPEGIITETLPKDSYIQAYQEGIEDNIKKLSSQCNQKQIKVDLDAEIEHYLDSLDIDKDERPETATVMIDCAEYFYNLGLKARNKKGGNK